MSIKYIHSFIPGRLGKCTFPCVNDEQKIDVDNQKLSSGRPHDYWISESLFFKILFFFIFLSLRCKRNTFEDDQKCLWMTSFLILVVL